MTKEEFDKYLAGHVKQIAREEKETQKLARQAEKKAQRIAEVLLKNYGVSKVYLFGSLARGDFTRDSDIDLAVVGLPEELFLEVYGVAEDMAMPLKVDLVLLETAEPSLKERALREGKRLYDIQGEKNRSTEKTGG
jgi:predicted nucleotidyltransferase